MKTELVADGKGQVRLELYGADSWRDFEKVAYYCHRKYKAKFSRRLLTPDACAWPASMSGGEIVLSWDDLIGTRLHFGHGFDKQMIQTVILDMTNVDGSSPKLKSTWEQIRFSLWRILS